jgi:hypothetical protein
VRGDTVAPHPEPEGNDDVLFSYISHLPVQLKRMLENGKH